MAVGVYLASSMGPLLTEVAHEAHHAAQAMGGLLGVRAGLPGAPYGAQGAPGHVARDHRAGAGHSHGLVMDVVLAAAGAVGEESTSVLLSPNPVALHLPAPRPVRLDTPAHPGSGFRGHHPVIPGAGSHPPPTPPPRA